MDKKTLLTIELIQSLPPDMPTDEKAILVDRIFKIPKYARIRIAIRNHVKKHDLPKVVCDQALEVVDCHARGISKSEIDKKYPDSIENNQNVFKVCEEVFASEV